jgi:AraC-like DNA-binding protein
MTMPARAECGVPPSPVLYRISTRAVPADARFDYWRTQFDASRIELPRRSGAQGYHGEMLASRPVDGVAFAELRGDPLVCHFGENDSDMILLGHVGSGTVEIRHGRDRTTPVDVRSGLVLFDCDRPFTTTSQHYAMTYLALPRALVVEAMGSEPVPPGAAVRVLPAGTLAASFQRHLHDLATRGARLEATHAGAAVRTARALAVSTLVGLRPHLRSLPESLDDALLETVRHQLRLHAEDPQFTAGQLAHMLGCSRAHLYRLFERQGQTIGGQLREFRMQRARTLLETQPGESIGMISLRCGYTDLSAFGKAFRRHFGFAPSECRESIPPLS